MKVVIKLTIEVEEYDRGLSYLSSGNLGESAGTTTVFEERRPNVRDPKEHIVAWLTKVANEYRDAGDK